jgi:hypothetical protein
LIWLLMPHGIGAEAEGGKARSEAVAARRAVLREPQYAPQRRHCR